MWVLTIPLSVLLTFSFIPSGLEGHLLTLLMVAMIAHVSTGLILLLGKLLFISGQKQVNQKLVTVVIFALSGAARGLTVGELLVRLKIEPEPNFYYRISSSIVILIFTFVLLSTVIENGKNNRVENTQLQSDIAKLEALKAEAKGAIFRIRDQVFGIIQKILSSQLSHVSSSQQISIIAEEMIRPLGHKLYLNNFAPSKLPSKTVKKERLRPRGLAVIMGSLIITQPFNLSILALAEIFIPLSLKIYTLGFGTELFVSLTPIIIPVSIIGLAKILQSKQFQKHGVGFSLSKVLGIWLLAAVSSALVSNAIPVFHTYLPNPGLYAFLQLALFLVVSSLFYGLQDEQLRVRNNLLITSDSLRLQEGSLKRGLALEEKRLGIIIHGEVQARLILLASQLRNSQMDSDQPDAEFVSKVQDILNETFKQIQDDPHTLEFSKSLENLTLLWEPVLKVNSRVQADVEKLLSNDLLISVAILEVIGEALTNAFRHGGASTAFIEILCNTAYELIITVRDNGYFSKGNVKGLGSKLLDEVSSNWQIATIDGDTELTVRIELAS